MAIVKRIAGEIYPLWVRARIPPTLYFNIVLHGFVLYGSLGNPSPQPSPRVRGGNLSPLFPRMGERVRVRGASTLAGTILQRTQCVANYSGRWWPRSLAHGGIAVEAIRHTLEALTRNAPVVLLAFLTMLVSGCSKTEVEVISPAKGAMAESFTEQARTRLEKTYPITMPVTGRIRRIELEPGDSVSKGQVLVPYDTIPFEKAVEEAEAVVASLEAELDVKDDDNIENTARIETLATIQAAEEALKAADEQVAAEKARADRADKELRRMTALRKQQVIPQTQMDDTILRSETSTIEWKRQKFYRAALKAIMVAIRLGPQYIDKYLGRKRLERKVLEHKLVEARAALARARHDLKLASVLSPIDGVVLSRYEQGDSTLSAGKPLLLLGDLRDLEVVADVMTQDALRLKHGGEVSLRPAMGRKPIPGRVKRVQPAGFTKLSSLGVEQQRVNVIVNFAGEHSDLGVGYRLQARFYTGSKADALKVPRYSVMQAPDRSFYVLKVVDGKLKKQPVEIGLRSDLELEVLQGLTESDVIVARPEAAMKEGMKVKITK